MFLRLVLQNTGPAEGDDAAKVGGVLRGDHLILIDDAEGRLAAPTQGVQLVPCLGTVEEQRSLLIHIAEGDRIGVAAVAGHGQDAGGPPGQDGGAVPLRELLAVPPHGSKHGSASFFVRSATTSYYIRGPGAVRGAGQGQQGSGWMGGSSSGRRADGAERGMREINPSSRRAVSSSRAHRSSRER